MNKFLGLGLALLMAVVIGEILAYEYALMREKNLALKEQVATQIAG